MKIWLDRDRNVARLEDREVTLTAAEFRLLKRFMKSPGVALTREELVQAITQGDAVIGERAVDVHVCALRKKFGCPELIQTVRGIGYRFVKPVRPAS